VRDALSDDVCTRHVDNLPIYEPCPDCHHTGMCHPSAQNPTLHACVLCLLLWSAPAYFGAEHAEQVLLADVQPTHPYPTTKVHISSNAVPVGAVKLHPMQGTIWVKLGELSGWQCVGNQAPRPITATADVVESWPVVGAVPFSPAAAWWDRVRKGRPGGQA
jgi:hypothetical protein